MDNWTSSTPHSYNLQPYAGPASRHTCPGCGGKRCFTLYIDENGEPLHPTVGRCDHESACAYHYTPKEYFRDHPDAKPGHNWRVLTPEQRKRLFPQHKEPKPLCTIPSEYVTRSVRPTAYSHLTHFLQTIIDPATLQNILSLYRIGITKAGDTIFFQIDAQGRCRTGKIMKYDPATGHRVKDENTPSKVTWVHSVLKSRKALPEDWQLTQCLFGEHLLPIHPEARVALVESEKTAIICAALMPKYIWLATGGKTQLGDKLNVLSGRDVIAFPDVDGYNEWKTKLALLPGLNIRVSDFLEKNATPQQREAHIDIADRLIEEILNPSPQPEAAPLNPAYSVLKYFSEEYRDNIRELIDELDLVPISISRITGNT